MAVQRKGGKKHRKHGRNKIKCARYRARKDREGTAMMAQAHSRETRQLELITRGTRGRSE